MANKIGAEGSMVAPVYFIPVAFDAVGASFANTGNATLGTSGALSPAITMSSNADLLLVYLNTGTGSAPTTSCTCGGQGMTSSGKFLYSSSGAYWQSEVFSLLSPPT